MKKTNAMLAKIEAAAEAKYRAAFLAKMSTLQQMCIDSAFLAASDVFRMGPGRCEAFGAAMTGYLHEMAQMMLDDAKDDPELAYTREKVDGRLRKICGEKFEPWEARYEGDL